MKGTGKWTVQQAADLSVAAPTIEASLDARFLSGLKDERVAAAAFYEKVGVAQPSASSSSGVDKAELVSKVRAALYASKICSYAQGMNIIRAKSEAQGWGVDLAALARIWKGGCIIRAAFLDDIRAAYARDPALASLLVDPFFGQAVADRQAAWRDVVALVRIGELFLLLLLPVLVRKEKNSRSLFILLNKKTKKQAVKSGVAAPGMTSSTPTAALASRPTWSRRSATTSGKEKGGEKKKTGEKVFYYYFRRKVKNKLTFSLFLKKLPI